MDWRSTCVAFSVIILFSITSGSLAFGQQQQGEDGFHTVCCPTKPELKICLAFNYGFNLYLGSIISDWTGDDGFYNNALLDYTNERQNEISYLINQKDHTKKVLTILVEPIVVDFLDKFSELETRGINVDEILLKNNDVNAQIIREGFDSSIQPLPSGDNRR